MDGRTSEYGLTKSVSSACNDTFNDYNDRLSLQRGERSFQSLKEEEITDRHVGIATDG